MSEPDKPDTGSQPRRIVPGFIRRRYAAKFIVSILVVVLIIAGTGIFSVTQASNTTEKQVNSQLKSDADQYHSTLSDWRKAMRSQASTFVRADQFRENNVQTIRLEAARKKGFAADAIYHVDADEQRVLESTEEEVAETPFEEVDEPWVNSVEPDAAAWSTTSAYKSDIVGGEYVMAFAHQIKDKSGSSTGRYLVFITSIEDRVSAVEGGFDRQKTVVTDSSGNRIYAFGGESGGTIESKTIFTSNYVTQEADGEVGSDGAQWAVKSGAPEGEAYQVSETLGMTMLVGLGIGLSALGLVGFVLGRQTVPSLLDLRSRAEEMEKGNLEVELHTTREDEIGQLYHGFASMRDALRVQIREAQQARQEAEEARKRAERLNDHLEQKADHYSDVMRAAGDGDLTTRMDPQSENEAMTEIAEEFNEMIRELEKTTEQVKAFAADVASASEEVTASSEEVRSASEQVSSSIQEIADGATKQNENLQLTDQEMNTLSTTIQEIAATSNEVADIAERTAVTGRKGKQAATEAIQGMHDIEEESKGALEEMETLDEEMEQIDELLEFIRDVAEQTNMLALNANIEASRSSSGDEDGEGFAVVAEEVKELSTETKEAAETIETRIERLKRQAGTAVDEVRETTSEVAEQTENVERAAKALEKVATYAEKTNTGVQEISAATEQQAASTQEVVAMVDEAATISEETTSEAETVASAAQQQTTALTEVSHSVSTLSEQANHLSSALDRFDTDADAETQLVEGQEPDFEGDVTFSSEKGDL
jgi:methyl-accepting chemotaxis protein